MNNSNQPNTVGNYFKASKILFGAFIVGVINFGLIILVLYFMEIIPLGNFDPELTIYFIIGSLLFFLAMQLVGRSVFKSKTSVAKNELNFSKKLSVYREAKLIQLVTMEAAALVAMVFLMIATHVFFLVIALLSLVQMIRDFPKKTQMKEILNLTYSEQQHLDMPDFNLD